MAGITAYSLSDGKEPMSHAEIAFLEQLADLTPVQPLIVNIGAADGLSTITFLTRRPEGVIYSVDVLPCEQEWANVRRAELDSRRVIRLLGRSEEIGRHFPYKIDLLFIDGGHFNAANDIKAWVDKVRFGGVIAFHDYMEEPPPNNPGTVWQDVTALMLDYASIGGVERAVAFWQR